MVVNRVVEIVEINVPEGTLRETAIDILEAGGLVVDRDAPNLTFLPREKPAFIRQIVLEGGEKTYVITLRWPVGWPIEYHPAKTQRTPGRLAR